MLYGISGKKRSGKDTVADMIVSGSKDQISRIALADSIKDLLHSAAEEHKNHDIRELFENSRFHSWPDKRNDPLIISNDDVWQLFNTAMQELKRMGYNEFLYGSRRSIFANKEIWTVRRLMQFFGTDIVCNHFGNDVWLSIALKKAISLKGEHVLITDIRQEHEYKYMKKLGGKIIFVNRPGTEEKDSHITEKGLLPMPGDVIVNNNGTLDQLSDRVLEILTNEKMK